MSEENSLDKIAHLFPNRFSSGDIDLIPYQNEDINHRVKTADSYLDELVGILVGEDSAASGAPMPWAAFKGNFEFRPNEMSIWTGFKGHGKSICLSQVLITMMGRGQRVFVLSPEFRPARVLERMLYQRIVSREPSKDEVLQFIAWATRHLWLYDVQSSLRPADVVALCRYVTKEIGVDHILIDSLMKCGIAPDDYGAQKKFVDNIQSVCHNEPVHIHLVAHARKGNDDEKPARLHDVKGSSEIADMAENVLSVWRNKPKEKEIVEGGAKHIGEPDALLVVEAQRNSDGWIGSVPLNFDRKSMLFYDLGGTKPEPEYVKF